jgi:hypothetical protein
MGRSRVTFSMVSGVGVAGKASATRRIPIVISTAHDLRALIVSPKIFRRLPLDGVVVALPGVDATVQQAFRQEIGRYARACGCAAGAAICLLAMGCLIFSVIFFLRGHAWMPAFEATAAGIVLVPLFTMAGKTLSVSLAGRRFRRHCLQMLDKSLAVPTQPISLELQDDL